MSLVDGNRGSDRWFDSTPFASKLSSAYQSASQSPSSSPWRAFGTSADSFQNKINALEQELVSLQEKYQQVCEERDALEDLLVQEQMKNERPVDKQLEEARARAATLEMELQAMAAKCDEWRKRAGQKAMQLNPATVQALLEEHLADVDETGVISLKTEVARLRDELARSEVLRFELFRQLRDGFSTSQWEDEEEGLKEQMEEVEAGREVNSKDIEDGPKWGTPITMETQNDDALDELLALSQASIHLEDVKRLRADLEDAESRLAETERVAVERGSTIELLEAKIVALASESPLERDARLQQATTGSNLLQQHEQQHEEEGGSHRAQGVDATAAAAAATGGESSSGSSSTSDEEVKAMVRRVQGQNRFTHFLLSLVFITSLAGAAQVVGDIVQQIRAPRRRVVVRPTIVRRPLGE